jgi:prepilin-type processing-associated H-X9-DG protein
VKRQAIPVLQAGLGAADLPYRFINYAHGINVETLPLIIGSYGFNTWVHRGTRTPKGPTFLMPFRSESGVLRPAATPVFAESVAPEVHAMVEHPPGRDLYTAYEPDASNMAYYTIARHGGRGTAHGSLPVQPGQSLGSYKNNIVFFDGHVQPIKLDDLWNLYWHAQWEPPAIRPP